MSKTTDIVIENETTKYKIRELVETLIDSYDPKYLLTELEKFADQL